MVREARAAYQRRDEELAQRRTEADILPTRRIERSWWESTGIDGVRDSVMSPVAEEVSNPMEDFVVLDENTRSDGDICMKVETGHSRDAEEQETTENLTATPLHKQSEDGFSM